MHFLNNILSLREFRKYENFDYFYTGENPIIAWVAKIPSPVEFSIQLDEFMIDYIKFITKVFIENNQPDDLEPELYKLYILLRRLERPLKIPQKT